MIPGFRDAILTYKVFINLEPSNTKLRNFIENGNVLCCASKIESIILFHAEKFKAKAERLKLSIKFDCPLPGKTISCFDDVKNN